MQIFFADDSKQNSPSRQGMGALVAAGGFCIPGDNVKQLETSLKDICSTYGFPENEEYVPNSLAAVDGGLAFSSVVTDSVVRSEEISSAASSIYFVPLE